MRLANTNSFDETAAQIPHSGPIQPIHQSQNNHAKITARRQTENNLTDEVVATQVHAVAFMTAAQAPQRSGVQSSGGLRGQIVCQVLVQPHWRKDYEVNPI